MERIHECEGVARQGGLDSTKVTIGFEKVLSCFIIKFERSDMTHVTGIRFCPFCGEQLIPPPVYFTPKS